MNRYPTRSCLLGLLFLFPVLCLQANQFKVLVFADAYDEWHYRNVPVAKESFEKLAELHFFELTFVDRAKDFAKLTFADYDVIVFISANATWLDENKRAEFKEFVHNGGGIVGVHAASATRNMPTPWPWFEKLIGSPFNGHPPKQTGVLTTEEPGFPACLHLPAKWLWTDEWYVFKPPFPDHLNVVLTVDESTYVPDADNNMGDWHPIAWHHEFEGARVFYTAIGHIPEAYRNELFLQHIYGGIAWAAGQQDSLELKGKK